MVAKCTGIIPIIPDLVSASGMKIGAVYKRVYGFTDLRGRPAGRGRSSRASTNQVTAALHHPTSTASLVGTALKRVVRLPCILSHSF